MRKTLEELITDTERLLYQSAGPGVQVYSEALLAQKIQNAFDHCFSSAYWPQFIQREVRTLDGVTGLVTAPFTLITQWDDVQHVFRANSDRPIPTMPHSYNPLHNRSGVLKYIQPMDDTNLFREYPLTATDEIAVVGRSRPAPFADTTVVPFDHLALEYFAVWSYFTDDDSNPAAAAKYQGLFDSRIKQLENDAFDNRVELNPAWGEIPLEWR
jgi:hypothetical protein